MKILTHNLNMLDHNLIENILKENHLWKCKLYDFLHQRIRDPHRIITYLLLLSLCTASPGW